MDNKELMEEVKKLRETYEAFDISLEEVDKLAKVVLLRNISVSLRGIYNLLWDEYLG